MPQASGDAAGFWRCRPASGDADRLLAMPTGFWRCRPAARHESGRDVIVVELPGIGEN
jgi:hypothetical protein